MVLKEYDSKRSLICYTKIYHLRNLLFFFENKFHNVTDYISKPTH